MGLGNVFGGSFGNVLQSTLPVLGGVVGSIFGAPTVGATLGGITGALLTGGPEAGGAVAPSGGGVPFDASTGVGVPQVGQTFDGFRWTGTMWEDVPGNGQVIPAAVPAGVAVVAGMTQSLALALARVASRLGIALTIATVGRFGIRLWRALTAFARRHPAMSVAGMLAALGMTANEAAEFLTWGAMRRRRRRGGISGRDIRICRRTLRRVAAIQSDLGGMRRGGRRGAARGAGVVVARAG